MTIGAWADLDLEDRLYRTASIDAPWALVERFSTLVRLDGSDDQWTAARYIAGRLTSWGVPHRVHDPELYLSTPRRARVWLETTGGRDELRAKAASFSPTTGLEPVRGTAVYLPPERVAELLSRIGTGLRLPDLAGRIVLVDGFFTADRAELGRATGSAGVVFLNPGERIHEGPCAAHWGAPDLDSLPRRHVPVAGVNAADGVRLREAAEADAAFVAIETELTEGPARCPVVVAEIPGTDEPELFVLLHGHLDGWHFGVGDNATGDALLLEVARVLWQHRADLRRSVRIAWWPGHSQGRYAGSAWYADACAIELAERAIAHVNCDSPGCREATEYRDVHWMAEADALCRSAVHRAAGQKVTTHWPWRAGDWSFSNLGVTGLFGLSSKMPAERLAELGYYPTGGCGGSVVWHAEDDTLDIADPDNLLRDIKVYLTLVTRLANAPVHPLDFTAAADAALRVLGGYQAAAGEAFDFSPAVAATTELRDALTTWYERLAAGQIDPVTANRGLRALARTVNPVLYTRRGAYRQDPALSLPPLPDLAPAELFGKPDLLDLERRAVQTHLTRGRNRLVGALRAATQIVSG